MLGQRAGKDVFIYSLTLRPELDRPADLAAYARQYRIGPGWELLTGAAADMEMLRRALGFADPDPQTDADLMRHTTMVRLGNAVLDRCDMMPAQASPERYLRMLHRLARHRGSVDIGAANP